MNQSGAHGAPAAGDEVVESDAVYGRRSRDVAGPAIVLATAGAVAGAITVGAVARRRRRSRAHAPEDAAALVARLFAGSWQGDFDVVDELVAPDYVGHDSAEPELVLGPQGVRSSLERYVAAFPGATVAIDEQLAESDRVATRWTVRGTHTGDLAGISPTGKDVTVSGLTITRVSAGKVVEQWTTWDRHGLLVQLGAVTEPAHA